MIDSRWPCVIVDIPLQFSVVFSFIQSILSKILVLIINLHPRTRMTIAYKPPQQCKSKKCIVMRIISQLKAFDTTTTQQPPVERQKFVRFVNSPATSGPPTLHHRSEKHLHHRSPSHFQQGRCGEGWPGQYFVLSAKKTLRDDVYHQDTLYEGVCGSVVRRTLRVDDWLCKCGTDSLHTRTHRLS